MKYFLLILFVASQISYSQISDGETLDNLEVIGEVRNTSLSKTENGEYDNYYLTFQNLEYPNITDMKTLSFNANDSELDKLYNFLKSGFKTKERKKIEVGENTVIIKKVSWSIRIDVLFDVETDGWFYLSKRKLDKLFGKR